MKFDVNTVCEKLETMTSREEARELLEQIKDRKTLVAIAEKYSLNSRRNMADLREAIVESVVGAKIRFEVLLNMDFNKPKDGRYPTSAFLNRYFISKASKYFAENY
jgi:hypothetical protein